jgi:acetate kinase
MRTLLASDDVRAKQAIELFIYRIVKEVGAMAASLRGIDALVFSAGIGEHAASIRATVCERLAWLGVDCDTQANERHDTLISSSHSHVYVCVIPTDEEAMIAHHTAQVLHDLSRQIEAV